MSGTKEGKTLETLGTPAPIARPERISDVATLDLMTGWRLSERTISDIEEIEANVRQGEESAGTLRVR